MSWIDRSLPTARSLEDARYFLQIALLIFIAYLVSAESAFFVGTLSDKIFAPFWPPNIVLLCALLLVRPNWRWVTVFAAFPAHVIAETRIGMPAPQLLVAFATNLAVAVLSAAAIQRLLGERLWFATFRKTVNFIIVVAFICPAIVAFGGAFVPILGGGGLGNYWKFWAQWFASNALGLLTLGPLALILVSEGPRAFWSLNPARQAEGLLISTLLIVMCAVVFDESPGHLAHAYLPALLYLPVPFILWSASRFAVRGASAAILTMAVVLIWRSLNGFGLFLSGTPESNVFALQLFLVSLAIPTLLLGSSIEEARNASRRLRQDEERMAFVAATAQVGLWQHNSHRDLFWATDHCRAMLGLPGNLPVTREAVLSVVHPDDRILVNDAIVDTCDADAPVEFRIVMPDGRIKWLLGKRAINYDASGAAANTSGVFTDITTRKVAEAEAELQRGEVAHLMRVSQVGALSGGLAHELTQPLTAILANAQAARSMLSDSTPDLKELADTLDDIIAEDVRAGEVIQRLRALLKNEKGVVKSVDVCDLICSTLRLLNSEVISRNVKTKVLIADDVVSVEGDAVQLQQVLLNLVMNALEAMMKIDARRRMLTLTAQYDNDKVEITVIDRGPGIDSECESRLFNAFFTTKERGLGLGLPICSSIIERHGGSLSLSNNADGGATARVHLPAERMKGR
jgi:signal transduction histidine kinase/integral membrane sensor domain MASE1